MVSHSSSLVGPVPSQLHLGLGRWNLFPPAFMTFWDVSLAEPPRPVAVLYPWPSATCEGEASRLIGTLCKLHKHVELASRRPSSHSAELD